MSRWNPLRGCGGSTIRGTLGRFPAAASPLAIGDHPLEIDSAGRRQDDVARGIAAVEVFAHGRDRQGLDAGHRAQHAAAQGVVAEEGRAAFLVGPERRLVLEHLDLFQDHFLLGLEVGLAERRAEDVGQHLRRPGLVLRQHGRIEDGRLLRGPGVAMRADLVELAVHVVGRAGGRALEGHVLEEMAHAGDLVGLVAGAGLDDEPQGRRVGLGIALGDDLQAVGQDVGKKFHISVCSRARCWPCGKWLLLDFQLIRPDGHDRELPRRILGQVVVDALARSGRRRSAPVRRACGRG